MKMHLNLFKVKEILLLQIMDLCYNYNNFHNNVKIKRLQNKKNNYNLKNFNNTF